jgi:hypothetical protein
VVGAAVGGMGLGILFTAIWGGFEGSAAMGGFTVGVPLGAIVGTGLTIWLMLRKQGAGAGKVFGIVAIVLVLVVLAGVALIYAA